jgi:hypothetical protein
MEKASGVRQEDRTLEGYPMTSSPPVAVAITVPEFLKFFFTSGSVIGGESISLRAFAVINQTAVSFTAPVV